MTKRATKPNRAEVQDLFGEILRLGRIAADTALDSDVPPEAAAWFRREDWGRWCEIDPDFQPDYSHWLRRMEKAVAQYQAAGTPIIKSIIVPDEFVAWAKANGKDFGSAARAEYAAHQAMEQDSLHKRTD